MILLLELNQNSREELSGAQRRRNNNKFKMALISTKSGVKFTYLFRVTFSILMVTVLLGVGVASHIMNVPLMRSRLERVLYVSLYG